MAWDSHEKTRSASSERLALSPVALPSGNAMDQSSPSGMISAVLPRSPINVNLPQLRFGAGVIDQRALTPSLPPKCTLKLASGGNSFVFGPSGSRPIADCGPLALTV